MSAAPGVSALALGASNGSVPAGVAVGVFGVSSSGIRVSLAVRFGHPARGGLVLGRRLVDRA